jgi:hypothetical protein
MILWEIATKFIRYTDINTDTHANLRAVGLVNNSCCVRGIIREKRRQMGDIIAEVSMRHVTLAKSFHTITLTCIMCARDACTCVCEGGGGSNSMKFEREPA